MFPDSKDEIITLVSVMYVLLDIHNTADKPILWKSQTTGQVKQTCVLKFEYVADEKRWTHAQRSKANMDQLEN